MPVEIVIIVGITTACIAVGFISIAREKKIWNGGICKETGEKWEFQETDSQGGRLYWEKGAGDVIWITWNCVDHPAKKIK